MELTIREIAEMLGADVSGDDSKIINNPAKIEEAGAGDITFFSNPKYEPFLYSTQAGAVLIDKDFEPKHAVKTTLIRVQNAYSAFTDLLKRVNELNKNTKTGVEQPAFVSPDVELEESVYVGAFAYVGEGVILGKNVKIYPHVYIGEGSRIGDNTVLWSGVKIYPGSVIGRNCVLHSGAIIGSDGFGFAPQKDGSFKKIPQVGNVVLGDETEIGANTVIDCATMGSTVIERGVKLDNLIQIAHNVRIGENTVIAAQSGVSGSSTIGKNCILAGQVGIVGHIKLADKTVVAAQSGVTKTIRKEGSSLLGSPAFDLKAGLQSQVVFKTLPEIRRRLDELEKKSGK